ncbi:MAG: hypothetical protein EA411_04245 [Saprospirales bacterium]|nr:MAG: hypothetical protein EA411_04245 [Saprospirales bacterium]
MEEIEDYLSNLPPQQSDLAYAVVNCLVESGELNPRLRYGIPFFYRKSWVCYINPQKSGELELAFLRAVEFRHLPDALDFKGRKMVAGILLSKPADLKIPELEIALQEALWIDDNRPYKGPSGRKKQNT